MSVAGSGPGPASVVVAEDDPDIRDLVALILEAEGWSVDARADGRSALEACREVRPDVVVLDVTMPGELDGLDVCRALRADAALVDVPVLMLTARAQEKDQARAASAGADGYLLKPFSPDDLLRRLDAARALQRQAHLERGARLSPAGLNAHRAAVPGHDAVHDRQPEPGALHRSLGAARGPEEPLEQPRLLAASGTPMPESLTVRTAASARARAGRARTRRRG